MTVDGERYVLIGNLARPDPDGNSTFFGRNATCINTGGESIAEGLDSVMLVGDTLSSPQGYAPDSVGGCYQTFGSGQSGLPLGQGTVGESKE